MRVFYLFFLIVFCPSLAMGQINLVPNPSFEDTVYCPFQLNQVDACLGWMNWSQSPDYFNACDNGGVNVPNSVIGFQYAHSGLGFMGLVTYAISGPPGGPNYREIVASQLSTSLVIGTKYYLSFYVNFPYDFLPFATNNIGILFTTTTYSTSNPITLNNHAQLFVDSIITDSINWIKISGSFLADSAYSYIALGNFFDDNHTDTLTLSPTPYAAYYYIDDVCVSTDSLYNEAWTGLGKNIDEEDQIKIYPNPSHGNINIENLGQNIESLELYDYLNKVVLKRYSINNFKNYKLSLADLEDGVYNLLLRRKKSIISKRIIINH